MSTTLNLVDHLRTLERNYEDLGRDLDALEILGRLSRFQDLPLEVAEEAQLRLAELQLRRGKFRQARRHLAAALLYRPLNAHTHYLMATALDTEDESDPWRAVEHYRQSLALDARQPACLCRFGLLAVRLGETAEGVQALRQAAALAGDDPEVLDLVSTGLGEAGETDEARRLLQAARFRHPRDARFRKLWSDFQFQLLYAEQRAARDRDAAAQGEEGLSMLLPFVRPAPSTPAPDGRRFRRDGASGIPAPHLPRPLQLPDQMPA